MRFGLEENIITNINNIFYKYENIIQVIIHGSRAIGNFKAGSDIDLTIKAKDFSCSDLIKTENQLDDLLLPCKIDISLFHQISNPDLIDHINRAGIVFYEKTEKQNNTIKQK